MSWPERIFSAPDSPVNIDLKRIYLLIRHLTIKKQNWHPSMRESPSPNGNTCNLQEIGNVYMTIWICSHSYICYTRMKEKNHFVSHVKVNYLLLLSRIISSLLVTDLVERLPLYSSERKIASIQIQWEFFQKSPTFLSACLTLFHKFLQLH